MQAATAKFVKTQKKPAAAVRDRHRWRQRRKNLQLPTHLHEEIAGCNNRAEEQGRTLQQRDEANRRMQQEENIGRDYATVGPGRYFDSVRGLFGNTFTLTRRQRCFAAFN
jgi:transposase-like protein